MLKRRTDIPRDPLASLMGFATVFLSFACLLIGLWIIIAIVRLALG